jgi:YD repeat-containing protein
MPQDPSNPPSLATKVVPAIDAVSIVLCTHLCGERDLAGQKTSVVNPRGDTTSFTYDALGNLLTETDPARKTITYTYSGQAVEDVERVRLGAAHFHQEGATPDYFWLSPAPNLSLAAM